MEQMDTVMSLKAELLKAFGQIKALQDGSSALKEEVHQLKDELKEKDGLLKRETKKRQARTKAYILVLSELTECQAACKTLEAALHQEPSQPATSWSQQMEAEEEKEALKEQVKSLEVGHKKLEGDLIYSNGLLENERKKRMVHANAYIDCLAELTSKGKELKENQADKTTSTVGLREAEAIRTENRSLRKQVEELRSERVKLEEEEKQRDKSVRKEAQEASAKLRLRFFNKMEVDNELESIERMWASEEEQQPEANCSAWTEVKSR